MDSKIILNKFELLPEHVQFQVLDYIDFLASRYLKSVAKELNNNEKEVELSEELKELLDKRVEHHEKNKYKAKSATDVLNDIAKEYGYEL